MPSTVTPAQVRALVDNDLEDADLQAVIDREESWLASQIGPLTGMRDVVFYPSTLPDTRYGPLPLPRHVGYLSDVTVSDGALILSEDDLRLSPDGWFLRRPTLAWLGQAVTVTLTPDDQAAVERAVIDLVRLAVTDSGYQSESMGSYAYSRGGGRTPRSERRAIIRSLRPPGNARTIRVQGATRLDTLPTA